jgi:signal transduction histidine kinase
MASYLAHEIKNSVGVALGYLKLSSEKEKYEEKVVKELNTISSNIERFLDFAKPMEIRKEKIELKETISEIKESLRDIDLTLEGEFPLCEGDKNLLKMVFFNLIKNSIEAKSTYIKIKSHWRKGEKSILIDFIDDGTGIPEGKAEKVFLPFYSTKEGGAGLGLSLSKKIILHHGGEIKIIPSKKGTTVRIILPVNG